MSNPKLILLNDDGEPEINIFIHGFGLTKSGCFNYAAKVNTLELRGRTYLLFWGSGSWSIPKPVVTTFKILNDVRRVKVVPTEILSDIGVDALFTAGRFLFYQNKAEQLGLYLKKHLAHIPNADTLPINLIGFSLGARVIHWALWGNSWSDYNINNVVLLGGATDSQSEDWLECLDEINGSIYNVYSTDDKILRAQRLQFEYPIGNYPIPHRHPKIKNYNCGLGHFDYSNNLEWIFDEILPKRKRSEEYYGWMTIECPWCEEEFLGNPYVPVQCPTCNLNFIYNHRDDEIEYSKEYPEPKGVDCPYCEQYTLPIQESTDYICIECDSIIPAVRKGNTVKYEIDCEECEGDGEVLCDKCDDEGLVKCEKCNGRGENECGYCGGFGCGHCDDTGKRDCNECEGDGTLVCSNCDEYGYVECEECNGEGIIINYE